MQVPAVLYWKLILHPYSCSSPGCQLCAPTYSVLCQICKIPFVNVSQSQLLGSTIVRFSLPLVFMLPHIAANLVQLPFFLPLLCSLWILVVTHLFSGVFLCSVEYSCQYLEVANLASLSTSCQTTLQFLNTSCQLTFCSISASVCRVTVRLTIDFTPISLS